MAAFFGNKIATFAEAQHWFNELMPNGIWLSREFFGLKALEFLPRDGSPLSEQGGGSTVKVVSDYAIGPVTLRRHFWQLTELDFAKRVTRGSEPVTLFDIGANIGLFSRQLLIALPSISKCFAYEPERENFRCLTHNLFPFASRTEMIEAAVSDRSGEAEFYLDGYNSGNFSFALTAMPKRHKKAIVKTVNVTEEAAKWLNAGNRILYKSDTEGFDEWIATLIPMAVWEKTFSGLMELWRIPGKPNLDIAAFTAILDGFSNKVFLGNPDMQTKEERCNTADVLDYIAAQADENHRDLAFWR